MKTVKLGETIEKNKAGSFQPEPQTEREKTDNKFYPHVYIDGDQDKQLADLKLGDDVTLRGKVVRLTKSNTQEGIKFDCSIELYEADIPGTSSDLEEKKMSDQEESDEDQISSGIDAIEAEFRRQIGKKRLGRKQSTEEEE